MNPRDRALEKVRAAFFLLAQAQELVETEREIFAHLCQEAHETGIPDREIHELTKTLDPNGTGYSRARIQQFRCGDPRKVTA